MTKAEAGIPVRILGEDYRLAGASPEQVRALADFVDRRFREALTARPTMDMKRLAVVVCLTLAEELFEERTRGQVRQDFEADAVRRVRRCRETLESARQERAEAQMSGRSEPN